MCWSYTVSVTFALLEAVAITFIFIRSRISSNPFVRSQWMIIPVLLGVCLMEAIEACIWSRPEGLMSVMETMDSDTKCDVWNKRLTIFTWVFVLPWQPLFVIAPCRRVGHIDNRKLLQIPEFMAIVFAAVHCLLVVVSLFTDDAHLRNLMDSGFKSYYHQETCTYVGLSGHHLHWTVNIPDTFMTPNAFTYSLLWSTVIFAKPKRYAAGIFLFAAALFWTQLAYFSMSFEAGSVWCWSALFVFVYFVVQPYVLPCEGAVESTSAKQALAS